MFISSFENNYILLPFFASLLDENDEELTLSATEMEGDISSSNSPNANVTKGGESMDVCNSDDDNIDKQQKQETGTERNERLFKEIKSMQDVLNGIEKQNSVCSEYFNQERVLVDVSIIMDTFSGGCQLISCPGRSKVKSSKLEGGVLKLSWECSIPSPNYTITCLKKKKAPVLWCLLSKA